MKKKMLALFSVVTILSIVLCSTASAKVASFWGSTVTYDLTVSLDNNIIWNCDSTTNWAHYGGQVTADMTVHYYDYDFPSVDKTIYDIDTRTSGSGGTHTAHAWKNIDAITYGYSRASSTHNVEYLNDGWSGTINIR